MAGKNDRIIIPRKPGEEASDLDYLSLISKGVVADMNTIHKLKGQESRAVFDVTGEKKTEKDIKIGDPMVLVTPLSYILVFAPTSIDAGKYYHVVTRKNPYVIMRHEAYYTPVVYSKGYRDFLSRSADSPEISWVIRFTKIDRKLFELCRKNPGLKLPIPVDYEKLTEVYGSRFVLSKRFGGK